VIKCIRESGKKAGIVINPDTPVDEILPYLTDVDFVLLMSVFPGFSGQSFIPDVLKQVRRVREILGPAGEIQIDGGITPENVAEAADAGANIFVAGSAIFGADDIGAAVRSLRAGAEEGAKSWRPS